MNRTYALVWNPSLATWSVANEHARRRGKGAGAVLATALLLSGGAVAADLPTGGQVVAGQGQIGTPSNNQMVIDQASNKLAIDWQSFDIGKGSKVTFNQPGSDSIALNRVLGADGSKIMGQLDANGRVFIINPNGVLFGQGAQVNVGGLVASTLDISNSDFEAGNYSFKGDDSNASVINNGQITAADGGAVALLGGTVSNNGVILANQGTVALAAGNKVTLDFAGDGLLNVQVDEAVVDALVENRQLIKADGGQVLLTANAGEALLKTVVNNTGVIEAQTLGEKDGKIVLLGSFDGGTVQVAGTLDASAPTGGNGGFIETSGAHVNVADSAKVTTKAANGKTGKWLIDPNDFTIAASGGDMTGTAVSTAVQNNNFEIQTATMGTAGGNGDIHVNDAITWNSANTLTLNAERNINVNAGITAQHANGKVALKYGQGSSDGGTADYNIKAPINLQSGQNFSTQKGSTGSVTTYIVVNDAAALQAMKDNLSGNYALGSNINLASISNWQPVGNNSTRFIGRLDGLGHTLSNLTINRSNEEYVGLFGFTGNGSVIRNIGLVGGSVSGNALVGGLVGYNDRGTITNAYATGSVSGSQFVGGLVGYNDEGKISNAYATGTVSGSGSEFVGGLVGYNHRGTITNAYAAGTVSGSSLIGGLVGNNYEGDISNAYATGPVSGGITAGGLAGINSGTITNAYATGSVSGRDNVGGLVGINLGNIRNVYATGSVSGSDNVGGLVGINDQGTIDDSFYTTTDAVGTALNNGGATSNSFSGNSNGVGKTWAELNNPNTFSGWDTNIWSYPAAGASVAGYGMGGLPYLTGVTRQADIVSNALFAGGFGTQASAYIITSWQQLANINRVLDGGYYFSLSNNLNEHSNGYAPLASATANGGAGWKPLGSGSQAFHGTFNGQSHTISGLTIDRRSETDVGLFGSAVGSTIHNIGLVGGSVLGNDRVGGLLGSTNGTSISNAYNTGSVSAINGGAGGLVGYHIGSIESAYTTGNVSGSYYVGGLVGINAYSRVSNVYTTGSVTGSMYVGGLAGYNDEGSITNAYAAGSVSNGNFTGGLVGFSKNGYVTAGFFATTDANGNPINTGLPGIGGGTPSEASAKTWQELTQASTFAAWDDEISSVGGSNAAWRIYEGQTGPLLRSFLKSVVVTVGSVAGKTYDGTGSTVIGSSYSLSDTSATLLGNASLTSVAALNAGTYALDLTGLYSNQQGYDINVVAGRYTIEKKALTVTGTTVDGKSYDGNTNANIKIGVLTGFVGNETVTASANGTFTNKNAGQHSVIANYSLADGGNGGLASNYTLGYTVHSATIAPKTLIVTGTAVEGKTYNGNTNATVNIGTLSGLVGAETLTASVRGTFDDKNAGQHTVTADYILANGGNGGLASNYTLGSTTHSATIDKKVLAVTGTVVADKVYDGTTIGHVNVGTLVGLAGNETLTVTGNSRFGAKNIGQYAMTAHYTLANGKNGGLASNYTLASTAGLTANINMAALILRANDVSKVVGRSIVLSGYAARGLVSGDSVTSVNLNSEGAPVSAAVGNYAIVTSDAQGTGLDNYEISYADGTLNVRNDIPYFGALASNSQTISTEPKQQAQESEALTQDMLVTNPLDERLNLQVINHGIRLPEGI